jgi:hypothetical protein
MPATMQLPCSDYAASVVEAGVLRHADNAQQRTHQLGGCKWQSSPSGSPRRSVLRRRMLLLGPCGGCSTPAGVRRHQGSERRRRRATAASQLRHPARTWSAEVLLGSLETPQQARAAQKRLPKKQGCRVGHLLHAPATLRLRVNATLSAPAELSAVLTRSRRGGAWGCRGWG